MFGSISHTRKSKTKAASFFVSKVRPWMTTVGRLLQLLVVCCNCYDAYMLLLDRSLYAERKQAHQKHLLQPISHTAMPRNVIQDATRKQDERKQASVEAQKKMHCERELKGNVHRSKTRPKMQRERELKGNLHRSKTRRKMQLESELKGNLHRSKTRPKMLHESEKRGNGLKWSATHPLQKYLQHQKMQKNMQKHCQNKGLRAVLRLV